MKFALCITNRYKLAILKAVANNEQATKQQLQTPPKGKQTSL